MPRATSLQRALPLFVCALVGAFLMAATFRASANASTNLAAAQSLACNKPAGATTADCLIARLGIRGGTNARVLAPPGWALIRRVDNGTTLSLFIFTKQGASGDPASWTWVFDSAREAVLEITCYYNNTAGHYVRLCAESAGINASGTSHSVPLPAQNVANSEIVTAWALASSSSWSPPSGQTEREDQFTGSGNDVTLAADDAFSASITGAGTISTTSGSAAVSCTWCGILAPDGIVQPNGPGQPWFVGDDQFAAGGSSVGFTEQDLLLGLPNEIEPLVGQNTGLQFNTAVRKFIQMNSVGQLGGQNSDGTYQTTFSLLACTLAMRSPMTYRIGGGPIRTNFGAKRGAAPAGLKDASMIGVDGVDVAFVGNYTMRNDLYLYGGTLRGSGILSILTTGASDQETAGNILQTNNNSILGDSSSIGRHYNNLVGGKGTINVLAGFLCQDSNGCIVAGNPTSGSLLSSTTATFGRFNRTRFGGSPALADVSLSSAQDLSNFQIVDPAPSGNAPFVRLTQDHVASQGVPRFSTANTKVVFPNGTPAADIPVRFVNDIDGTVVDTKTFSDGDLGFLGFGYQNGVKVCEDYRQGGTMLRRDRAWTIYVNAPGGAFPVNSAYASFVMGPFGWPGATSEEFRDLIMPVQLRLKAGPTANFGADKGGGLNPLAVQFTDESLPGDDPIIIWAWDFGDGGTSTGQNPSHSYAQPGSYAVRLTVTTATGQSTKTYAAMIFVQAAPVLVPDIPFFEEQDISELLRTFGQDAQISVGSDITNGVFLKRTVPLLDSRGAEILATEYKVQVETDSLPLLRIGAQLGADARTWRVYRMELIEDGAITEAFLAEV